MNTTDSPLVTLTSLSASYGTKTIFADVSFTVPPSSFIVIQGNNGSGKTTLLNIIAGLYPKYSGTLTYASSLIHKRKIRRDKVSYMSANFLGPTRMSGKKYLEAIAAMRGLSSSQIQRNITKYTPNLLSHHELNQNIDQYSSGMVRKLYFIATIISEPTLILLDEPFENMDIPSKIIGVHHLSCLQSSGSAIICTTHELPPQNNVTYQIYDLSNNTPSINYPFDISP